MILEDCLFHTYTMGRRVESLIVGFSILALVLNVRRLWQDPQGVASYVPGRAPNWEGQHPPLYYLVMIVPYRLARAWSPGMRLLFLRLFSVALACGSLVFWFKSNKLFGSESSRRF